MRTIAFPESRELFDHATSLFERLAEESIAARSRFLVALSGGSTPTPLYERLRQSGTVDWRNVCVLWSDERCVPPDDPDSNYGAACEALLDHIPISPEQVRRIEGERPPVEAADAYEIRTRELLGEDGRLDLILLGIGADGHTASLFPRHQALTEANRWILPVHVSARPPWRVTMTLPLINSARHVLFLAVGSEKSDAVSQIERGTNLPAALVRPTDGEVTLLTDGEAGALLG